MVRLTGANSVREAGNRIAEMFRMGNYYAKHFYRSHRIRSISDGAYKNFRKGGANARPAIQSAAVLPAEDGVCHDACRGLTTFSDSF
jgi:hypothetical protein